MDRNSRHTITCIDEALNDSSISATDRAILNAMREFIINQWLPHLEVAKEYRERIESLDAISKKASAKLLESSGFGGPPLIDVLAETARRVDVWLDAGCWFIRYGWWITASILGLLVWLIRNHETIALGL